MKALLFNYRCADCNTVTKAPGLLDMAYGEFIMFNNSGDSVYLNSFQDPVFNELEALFEEKKRHFELINKRNTTDIFQAAFSIVCDPSEDGSRYSIGTFPICKGCGSKNMVSWDSTNPPEYTENIKLATHEEWNRLSDLEKKVKLEKIILEELQQDKG